MIENALDPDDLTTAANHNHNESGVAKVLYTLILALLILAACVTPQPIASTESPASVTPIPSLTPIPSVTPESTAAGTPEPPKVENQVEAPILSGQMQNTVIHGQDALEDDSNQEVLENRLPEALGSGDTSAVEGMEGLTPEQSAFRVAFEAQHAEDAVRIRENIDNLTEMMSTAEGRAELDNYIAEYGFYSVGEDHASGLGFVAESSTDTSIYNQIQGINLGTISVRTSELEAIIDDKVINTEAIYTFIVLAHISPDSNTPVIVPYLIGMTSDLSKKIDNPPQSLNSIYLRKKGPLGVSRGSFIGTGDRSNTTINEVIDYLNQNTNNIMTFILADFSGKDEDFLSNIALLTSSEELILADKASITPNNNNSRHIQDLIAGRVTDGEVLLQPMLDNSEISFTDTLRSTRAYNLVIGEEVSIGY